MPKISDERRSERIETVYQLIKKYGDGIKTTEIAETLNYAERTTREYVNKLEAQYRITKNGLDWFPLNEREQRPLKFEPSPEEAVVLYIALRMLVKQSDRRNPLAEGLLLKLANLANTELHLGDDLEQAAVELAQRPTDHAYQDIFQQVLRAYLHRRKLEIVYHPYKSEPFRTVIAPYLIEPSGFGFGMYAIGHSSTPDATRTYKLERIQEAKLSHESFDVPPDFPGLEILRNAWSIYYGETTVEVVLRFAPEVARRVRESNWRGANVQIDSDEDGYVVYSFEINDTTDLIPWIRTWGANVEVLAPDDLRDQMIGEARRLAQVYGWNTSNRDDDSHARFGDIFGD